MRSLLLLGLLSCISVACATVTDTPDDGSGGAGNVGGTDPGTGGDTTGTGGGVFGTGGVNMGGASTGGTSSGGAATGGTSSGGAATGGSATGGTGTGGGVSLDCEDAVDWVANEHSVNYPPGQLFNYEGAVYRYDGTEDMTYVNGDCPPDQSGEAWCQSGQYPYSEVTDC